MPSVEDEHVCLDPSMPTAYGVQLENTPYALVSDVNQVCGAVKHYIHSIILEIHFKSSVQLNKLLPNPPNRSNPN